jgi:ABC-type microcin C transport system permease subunit YejB
MVINRVGPLSSAKVIGLLYAILGLAMGAIISLISAAGGLGHARPATPLFGIAAVVFIPIAYGVMGFVMTVILAALYNGLAKLVGGVEIDVT